MDQMFHVKTLQKFTQIGIFWLENMPSGNPAEHNVCGASFVGHRLRSFFKLWISLELQQQQQSVLTRLFHEFITCTRSVQGCQVVCFQAKNPNLGKFWRAFEWKMLVLVFNDHL
jgi:hypothetical protein